ncbi:autotransporter assembly complex family protein [Pelagibius sp. Alg239-R121]|uniref:autotransporter assembly complex protein TamA n=1 Tax=Pelagibius sp. Alg239-R121 TaxID=2993448 RepID=UPI0024A66F70|nr:autotransporter assembly complex family protein [Pelagibius sp. Alg239-R121]
MFGALLSPRHPQFPLLMVLTAMLTGTAYGTLPALAQKAGEHASDGYRPEATDETGKAVKGGGETADEDTLAYELEIDGTEDDALISLLLEASQLERLKEKPPASFAALERRVEKDLEAFDKVLRSEGHYANEITSRIEEASTAPQVTITVTPGPLFHLESYKVDFQTVAGRPDPAPIDPVALGIKPGMAARAESIVAAQRQAIRLLGSLGFPRAEVLDQKAVVDHATMTMSVTLSIDGGPPASFGALSFEGLEQVEEDYLRRLAEWPRGEIFNRGRMAVLRRKLSGTGLFESVKVREAENVGADGELAVIVETVERERRSIGAGVEYSSSEGAGTRFYWEHRNIFGRAERLRGDLIIAELRQELSGSFIKPDIWQLDQDLKASAGIKHEDSDAFEEQTINGFIGLERKWRDNWTLGAGTSFEYSIIDDQDGEDTFALVGLPLTARYDSSDDLLDPTSGFRIGTAITPYVGVLTESTNFVRGEIDASTYYSVIDDNRLILAARGKLGSIAGEETDDIPATKRFYAGGGGSVRGYEFRTLGPLDNDNDPLGGRSVVELGFEARIKVAEDIGIVPFVEGGNVFDDEVPDLGEELQWAAGLGFRYYTAVGPLRLDVAVPVNRRSSDIDDAFQFYISLGQAF